MIEHSGARGDILRAIRCAVPHDGVSRLEDYAAITRRYEREGRLDPRERIGLFTERLDHYNVGAHHATPESLPAAIASACVARGKRRMVVPERFPASV